MVIFRQRYQEVSKRSVRLFHKISLFSIFLVLGIFFPAVVNADETTQVEITLSESKMDYDSTNRLVRANVEITNYNPNDGYYFIRVTNTNTDEVIKESEILPKYIGNQVYGVKIAHLIPDQVEKEEIIGDYLIEIYSEYGSATASAIFSVVDPYAALELSSEQSGELVPLVVESNELETETTPPESRLPSWIRDIFIWYAEGTLSENELINAIEFLVNQRIININ